MTVILHCSRSARGVPWVPISPSRGSRSQTWEVVTGRGSVVVTADGTEYLDFTSGIAVTSTGHCHPKVVAAIAEQAQRFIHAQVMVYRHPLLEPLAGRLAEVCPAGIDTFFFTNSGAEATESAVKLARQATGRPNLVVFQGSFHGRTAQTMAMTTSKSLIRAGYQPLPAESMWPHSRIPGRGSRMLWKSQYGASGSSSILLASQTAPGDTAAMVIEPELGEGGYLPAPVPFLRGVAPICAVSTESCLLSMKFSQALAGQGGCLPSSTTSCCRIFSSWPRA